MKSGFTLLETIVIVVIIAILATLAVPAYNKSKEMMFDNQAKADLKLIASAEKIYKVDWGYYYPSAGNVTSISEINGAFSLNLPSDGSRKWDYQVDSSGCSQATRLGSGSRIWSQQVNSTNTTNEACP